MFSITCTYNVTNIIHGHKAELPRLDVGYKPHVPSLTSHYFAEMSATIHLCRGDRVLEISLRSYAAQQLARMFNVEQDTIWLKSRYKDGHVYFPNPAHVFVLK